MDTMSAENLPDRDIGADPVRIEAVVSDGTRRVMTGCLQMFAGRALFVRTGERISPSTAVSVECSDVLFIGEVAACGQDTASSWKLRIAVKHTLTHLQSLMNLRTALLGANAHAPVRPEPVCGNVRRSC